MTLIDDLYQALTKHNDAAYAEVLAAFDVAVRGSFTEEEIAEATHVVARPLTAEEVAGVAAHRMAEALCDD